MASPLWMRPATKLISALFVISFFHSFCQVSHLLGFLWVLFLGAAMAWDAADTGSGFSLSGWYVGNMTLCAGSLLLGVLNILNPFLAPLPLKTHHSHTRYEWEEHKLRRAMHMDLMAVLCVHLSPFPIFQPCLGPGLVGAPVHPLIIGCGGCVSLCGFCVSVCVARSGLEAH